MQNKINKPNEQETGESLFFLIMNPEGEILGRMSLVDLDPLLKSGHAGYRVGEKHIGKGIANKALALLIEKAI
ncbi:GNAT family N-acetyltransferase [Salisediminibacterium beveridgei]|uniref:GNAT family acetyltransferase n=1 Tax=Salisediminibacterium beveridgei TaxID=632773 RepID=A0A1D7QY52_9BACI|nr:GNAT family N-acetyltransferase [Salisediminibacterium beveridgei]AOM83929.1 GNAT family acetyltransferase [Salisediminibacterium beveridgei]